MSKIEVIYSQQSSDFLKGRAYANPRHFTTPRVDVSKVFVVGDWPKVVEAYEALGVPVERLDAEAAKQDVVLPEGLKPGLSPEDRAGVEIPENWAALKYPALRSLASKLSDAPIKNGVEAHAAIEAEVARRAEVVVEPPEGADA